MSDTITFKELEKKGMEFSVSVWAKKGAPPRAMKLPGEIMDKFFVAKLNPKSKSPSFFLREGLTAEDVIMGIASHK